MTHNNVFSIGDDRLLIVGTNPQLIFWEKCCMNAPLEDLEFAKCRVQGLDHQVKCFCIDTTSNDILMLADSENLKNWIMTEPQPGLIWNGLVFIATHQGEDSFGRQPWMDHGRTTFKVEQIVEFTHNRDNDEVYKNLINLAENMNRANYDLVIEAIRKKNFKFRLENIRHSFSQLILPIALDIQIWGKVNLNSDYFCNTNNKALKHTKEWVKTINDTYESFIEVFEAIQQQIAQDKNDNNHKVKVSNAINNIKALKINEIIKTIVSLQSYEEIIHISVKIRIIEGFCRDFLEFDKALDDLSRTLDERQSVIQK